MGMPQTQDIVKVSTGYEPRPLQQEIHNNLARFSVLGIHRRFGKTVLAINHGIDYGLRCTQHNPRVSFISPLYKQSKTVAWQYLKDYTFTIPNVKQYESELRVDIPLGMFNGKKNTLRIQLFGADNPDSLRGMYHDLAIFDEFGNQPQNVWLEVVSPALADRNGSALFLGTPNGKNYFHKIFMKAMKAMKSGDTEWFAATYRADETGVIPDKELEQQRANMDASSYAQEFLCDWQAAIKGAYYADDVTKLRDAGQICRVPYIKELPCYVAFDLGIDDATACIFIQCYRDEIRIINYLEFTNIGLNDILKELKELPYNYAELIMPWDVNVRELSTGRTRLEMAENMGFDVVTAKKISIEDGIHAVRTLLSQCWISQDLAMDFVDCLENYCKVFDPKTQQFLLRPLHNEYSHGCDAMRYFCVAYDKSMGDQYRGGGGPNKGRSHKVKRSMD